MLWFLKDNWWIIGPGGIIGLLLSYIPIKNYIKEYIEKPNKELFVKHFKNINHNDCFDDNGLINTDGKNVLHIMSLVGIIVQIKAKFDNSFNGVRTRIYFYFLCRVSKKLDNAFDTNFARFYQLTYSADHEKAIALFLAYKKDIECLERRYKRFYRSIFGYYR